jgi:hypothetical protein
MSLKTAQIVAGHKIQEAVELSMMKPVVTNANNQPMRGDIGRLMPFAEDKHHQDLQGWIDYFSERGVPCCVVKRAKGFVLYKERRCQTGTTWTHIKL